MEFSKSYDDSISTSQDDWGKKNKEDTNSNHRYERNALKSAISKSPLEKQETRKKKTHFVDKTKSLQSSPRETTDIEKSLRDKMQKEKDAENRRPVERERYVKRTKLKAKSPTQSRTVDASFRGLHYERRDTVESNMKLHLNIPTSDDSSEQYKNNGIHIFLSIN